MQLNAHETSRRLTTFYISSLEYENSQPDSAKVLFLLNTDVPHVCMFKKYL